MRKWMVMLLTLVMVLGFTACGGGSNGENDQGSGSDPLDGTKSGKYVEIMESGTYYMDMAYYMDGVSYNMILIADGENSSVQMDLFGFDMRVLTLDGKEYYLNDEDKTYMVLESTSESATPIDPGFADVSGLEHGKDGHGAIAALDGVDNKEYDYEEFSMDALAEGSALRYYYKGDDLFAIEFVVEEGSFAMVINELSGDIPAGSLELPNGYSETDEMGFFS